MTQRPSRATTLSSRAAFEATIAAVDAGDLGRAEALCREALAARPRDVNASGLLGAILVKLNRNEEAEAELRRVIALAPGFAKPHEDLGYLLTRLGRPAEALALLEVATTLDETQESAWHALGRALAMLGRGREADAAFERCFALSPERRLMALAAEHQKEGRFAEAAQLYRRVLRQRPRNVDALRLLAAIALRNGKADKAERLLERAIAIASDFTAALLDLGRLRKEQERYAEALQCFDRALALEPDNPQVHYLRGSTLASAALTREAVAAYERCLELRPAHAGALLGIGHLHKTEGRAADAVAAYKSCIDARPDGGEAWWSLANLKTYRFGAEEIAAMEARLAGGGLTVQSEVNFLFALAKAHEDRGEYGPAWERYRAGNDRQRTEVSYDPVHTEMTNDRLVEVFDAEFLAARAGNGLRDAAPIFIVGLPRSGSTLLEQILASHSQVEGTSELPYLSRVALSLNRRRADGLQYPEALHDATDAELRALGEAYVGHARLHRRTAKPRFIDKNPNNFPHVGLLALILPDAKIIDARRHPLDAALGCYRQLFARGQAFTYDLNEIGEYWLQYQRMMDHWAAVLPGRVLTVQYEDVVADLAGQASRLVEFCGLPWEDGCLRFHETERAVRTPSAEQVRQPIYADAVGRWRHYEPHLGELLEVLAPLRERYRNYEAPAGSERLAAGGAPRGT
ncbi:MAG: tetratricopeptide repeat protein [Gammaproteobacteria bacterium]|nr:tetratricopeptide repeat protein [Gammaproteobacteria bacterium]